MTEYERVNWEDLPSTETPLNADNLNVMDAGIAELFGELATLISTIGASTDAIDLLNRRYAMIWQAIEEFIAAHGSDGDSSDPNAYPRTGGEVYGPVRTSRYFRANKSGWSSESAGFQINANGYGGFNVRTTYLEGSNEVPREVAYGITENGYAGIYDRTMQAWILRATPASERNVYVAPAQGQEGHLETVTEFDVSIPHFFQCRNWEFTEDTRPVILTAKPSSIGNRISRIQTHTGGSGKIRVYGDFWDHAQSMMMYDHDWVDGQGWTYGNQARSDINGDVSMPTVTVADVPVSSSDIRLKENVEDSNLDALDLLMSFRMRQFDWKGTGEHWDVGFVADEIEEFDQRLTSGGGYDEDGHMIIKTIDTLYLEGVITKALQQAVKRIEMLEAKVAALEEKG